MNKIKSVTHHKFMKYISHITILVLVGITSFCGLMYYRTSRLNYNEKGIYFSVSEGVTYYEQTKEVYGVITLVGIISIGVYLYKRIKS